MLVQEREVQQWGVIFVFMLSDKLMAFGHVCSSLSFEGIIQYIDIIHLDCQPQERMPENVIIAYKKLARMHARN